MLKKIFTLFALIMIVCTGCGKKQEPVKSTLNTIMQRGQLVAGVKTDTYPFGFINRHGQYDGFDVALAKIIGKRIFGVDGKVKFVPVTSSDRMMKLYSENVDILLATMSITPARDSILDFSHPYYTAGQSLLVRKGSPVRKLTDLSGRKAIIVFGSTGEKSLRTAIPNVKIIGFKNYHDAYKALKNGRADAIVSDDTILLGLALKDDKVELLPKKYSKEPYAVALRKGAESKELMKVINEVIDTETRNGHIRELKKLYGISKY